MPQAAAHAPAPQPAAPASIPKPADNELPAPREQATRLEQEVKQALADPARAVPLEQLVRRLRTELRADRGRCWLFAAAGEHHDTSDLVAHLGPLLAGQLGETLLIDATGEHGSLSLGLDAATKPGLSDIALHNRPWPSLLMPTAWPHLFLLPAGQQLASVSDSSEPWASLLAQAERRFRLVLIDGGPADAPLCGALSRLCDATYLVLRLGLTETSEARRAIAQFRSRGARILGTIATSAPNASL
jgi:Mrp family chromosome partitioning ATPase